MSRIALYRSLRYISNNIQPSSSVMGGKQPRILRVPPHTKFTENLSDELLSPGIEALRSGGLIALPTDTIYGVASLAQNQQAVNQIYHIKRRVETKPLAICVGNVDQVHLWCKVTIDRNLLEALLPGPVTPVFTRRDTLNPSLNPDRQLVGVRIPDYPLIQALCTALDEPIALTSANVSNTRSSVEIQEFEVLWSDLEVVYDGGTLGTSEEQRLGSTVVNLSNPGYFNIIRPGSAHHQTKRLLEEHGLEEQIAATS